MRKYCEHCGAVIGDNSKFCEHCGTPVETVGAAERYCQSCGALLERGAAFCTNCGVPVQYRKTEESDVPTLPDNDAEQGEENLETGKQGEAEREAIPAEQMAENAETMPAQTDSTSGDESADDKAAGTAAHVPEEPPEGKAPLHAVKLNVPGAGEGQSAKRASSQQDTGTAASGRHWFKRFKAVWSVMAVVIAIAVLIFKFSGTGNIQNVQDMTLDDFSKTVTVGQAFEKRFVDEEWSTEENGELTYVVFKGRDKDSGKLWKVYFTVTEGKEYTWYEVTKIVVNQDVTTDQWGMSVLLTYVYDG